MYDIRPPKEGDFIWAGNSKLWIQAYGTADVVVTNGDEKSTIKLLNVALCPDILCNLVSFRILRQQGIWWDTQHDPTTLRTRHGQTISHLRELHNQWVIEYNPVDNTLREKVQEDTSQQAHSADNQPADQSEMSRVDPGQRSLAARKQHSPRKNAKRASAILWHQRLGHPGPAVIEHLMQQAEGVRVKGPTTVECDSCGVSKLRRQISRAPRINDHGPGERIAIDFHTYEDGSFNKEKSQMLITDRYSGFQWDYYFTDNRTARSIIKLLNIFITFLKTQFNIDVKVVEADNEIVTVKREVFRWLESKGIVVEPSAPDTQAQNGGAERSGGVNKEKSRAMRIGAKLSWDLWPEITRTGVYLYNRSPNYANNWKSPYEVFFTRVALNNGIYTTGKKPNLAHLKAYGCKAFALTSDTLRGISKLQRLDAKAFLGYLVGYRSSNIYRIWIPPLGKVISTRDVIFDESTLWDGKADALDENLMHNTLQEIKTMASMMERPAPAPQPENESFYEDETSWDDTTSGESSNNNHSARENTNRQHSPKHSTNAPSYPTPPTTPPPVALLTQLFNDNTLKDNATESISYERMLTESGSAKTVPWAAAFMAGTQAGHVGRYQGQGIDKAQLKRMLQKGLKIHRSQLPPVPTCRTKLEDHPLYEQFKAAEKSHLDSHGIMKSWLEIPHKTVKLTGQQILDCMWVYTYKFNKHNVFEKCKARLVVRGDQQRNITSQDTYAATLASRSFRLLMSIAAKYDMELTQWDVTNAFVHATMDREIYMRMPPGYQKPGTVLKVQKALYGLRISPLLWQKEFTATLEAIGFTVIPHEPCCMIKDGIIIFFYVDDIIIAHHKSQEKEAYEAINLLKKRYTMTGGGELQWFLGVAVIRDRKARTISLSQAAYVEKISRLIERRDLRHDTPMAAAELMPNNEIAAPSEVNKYQRKIGSLLFAAITTRPDIAFATSRLARFLVNPSKAHQNAADRVLLYLESTKTKALCLGGGEGFQVASDASFADNTLDRKSSQGYVIKLFGGLITWRASKQDTVTTSTTEAELLALSQVAKEALFTTRLLRELSIDVSPPIYIQCDNQQTIRLVTEEVAKLHTKLRHVDIHNHWLREVVAHGRISVKHVPSAEMIADGLTKILPVNKWDHFLDQLGLIDEPNYQPTIDSPIQEIQDLLEGITVADDNGSSSINQRLTS